jgi:hypothetical protein
MPVTAIEPKRLSDLLKVTENQLWDAGYMAKEIVVNQAADTDLVIGTVLGKITASGKYIVSLDAAADGSEVPAVLVIEQKSVLAAADTNVLVLFRGPAIVADLAIELGDQTLAEVVAGLEAMNPPVLVAAQL